MQEQRVQDVANRNKIKFELCGDVADQAFSQFNENWINNPDPQSQTENNKTPEAEYPNENDSKDRDTNKTSAIPNFMLQILPDDEIVLTHKFLTFKTKWILRYGS